MSDLNVKHLLNDEAVCPYCDEAETDSWEISQDTNDEWVQVECGNCSNTYLMERVVTVQYSTKRADCANAISEHKWKNRISAPREYSVGKQVCEECFSERIIQSDEWEKIDADHSHPQNWRCGHAK
jgi:hypothetical protein